MNKRLICFKFKCKQIQTEVLGWIIWKSQFDILREHNQGEQLKRDYSIKDHYISTEEENKIQPVAKTEKIRRISEQKNSEKGKNQNIGWQPNF